jgi:serine/threonine-protein kinase
VFETGAIVGGYRLDKVIGQGGMGVVYRAEQVRLGRPVALKVISSHLAADPGFRERFERESRLAAAIDHPNIVPVYEAGEVDGELFIAMRFVDGCDLHELLAREGPLSAHRASDIVCQTAAALDAAHALGLVHRDIKPANVLVVTTQGREHVYLGDFGLAKSASSQSGITRTGDLVGSLDYLAPEQIEGKPLDARTDGYALTCVLYQLLCGTVPFPRDSEVATIYAHLHDPAPKVSDIAEGVPRELDAVVARGMAKRPDERYPSAGDLGRAASAGASSRLPVSPERSVGVGPAAPTEMGPPPATPTIAPAAPTETDRSPSTPTEPLSPHLAQATSSPRRRPHALVTLAVLGALLVGIGVGVIALGLPGRDEESEGTSTGGARDAEGPLSTERAGAVVEDYLSAMRNREYERACSLLTLDAQQQLTSIAANTPGTGDIVGCPNMAAAARPTVEGALSTTEVIDTDLSADGNVADVTTTTLDWKLEEQQGEWKISELGLPGSGLPQPSPSSERGNTTIQQGDTKAEVEQDLGPGGQPARGAGCVYESGGRLITILYRLPGDTGPSGSCPSLPSDATVDEIVSE